MRRLFAIALVLAGCRDGDDGERLRVGMAASLRTAAPEIAARFSAEHDAEVSLTFAASDDLAELALERQSLDVLFVGGPVSVGMLIDRGVIDRDDVTRLARNHIVLAGRPGSHLRWRALAEVEVGQRVAIAAPAVSPAGRYAESYLRALGVWSDVQPHLVAAGDVAAALAMLQRGDAVAAIVYRTDAAAAEGVVVLDQARGPDAPDATVYAVVLARDRRRRELARALVAMVAAPSGQALLRRFGFEPSAGAPTRSWRGDVRAAP